MRGLRTRRRPSARAAAAASKGGEAEAEDKDALNEMPGLAMPGKGMMAAPGRARGGRAPPGGMRGRQGAETLPKEIQDFIRQLNGGVLPPPDDDDEDFDGGEVRLLVWGEVGSMSIHPRGCDASHQRARRAARLAS